MNSSHFFLIVLALLLTSLCNNVTLARSLPKDKLNNPESTTYKRKWHGGTPDGICHTSVASFYGVVMLGSSFV
uniref:Transmembrane protein n=1 Tax=Globodera pallida TaxID=36090 RepID=A0A183BW47_GLOPA